MKQRSIEGIPFITRFKTKAMLTGKKYLIGY